MRDSVSNKHKQLIGRNIYLFFIGILFMFIIPTIVSSVFKETVSSQSIKQVVASSSTNMTDPMLFILGDQIPYFSSSIDQEVEYPSIISTALKIVTNINYGDPHSLLGNVLPGIGMYNTEIYVAGDGTDYTTLPIESGPPVAELLQQREDVEKELSKIEEEEEQNPSISPEKKSVFIYHSHSWEAFSSLTKKGEDSSINPNENVVSLGSLLKDKLEDKGIGVVHDTTEVNGALLNRDWKYAQSYKLSRETITSVMGKHQDVTYLIDIHRDSQPKKITTVTINGTPYARLFFIVGKEHPNFEKNLDIVERLNKELEKEYPGISRGIFLKGELEGNGTYNQDKSNNAMLIEIGGVENNQTELENTVKVFADVFGEFYMAAEEVSTSP
jgi:stage II sporulation protein P